MIVRKKLLYDTNEKPPFLQMFILAFQHVFAMFGATILVPILINKEAGTEVIPISTALLASGIGTLIYIICTKKKSPVYLGSSFAYITPVILAYNKGGLSGFTTGIIAVGLIYILVAILIKFIGKKWIDNLLPPVVIGPMIIIIGLSLAPNAINQIGLSGTELVWENLLVAFVAFAVTIVVAIYAKGFLKIIPFLMGIISGYIVSLALGIVDFSELSSASILSVPRILIPFKDYSFSLVGLIIIAPIALVSITEHIGDHMALSSIIGKDLVKDPGLDRTLLGDGLATTVAGLIGGPANTTYGENTSVVGMSRVASVWVIGLAAIISIILSFFGIVSGVLSTIPSPVLGGVSLILYGFISVNGLKVLIENKVDYNDLKNVIITSTMLIFGLGGAMITISNGDLSVSVTGMSLAAIVGIILNLILKPNKKRIKH
jgi:uracil permease